MLSVSHVKKGLFMVCISILVSQPHLSSVKLDLFILSWCNKVNGVMATIAIATRYLCSALLPTADISLPI